MNFSSEPVTRYRINPVVTDYKNVKERKRKRGQKSFDEHLDEAEHKQTPEADNNDHVNIKA